MTGEIHLIQGGDLPVLACAGRDTLSCRCGQMLVTGYDPAQLLRVGIQCAACGAVTVTPSLPEGRLPPPAVSILPPATEPLAETVILKSGSVLIGQAEMGRVWDTMQPHPPASSQYRMSVERLDEVAALYERAVGFKLPEARDIRDHALGWAVGYLRSLTADTRSWAGLATPLSRVAAVHVAGFAHFAQTWSRHPLFPAMASYVAVHGGTLHGLAPFAVAHCLTMMGNQTAFSPDAVERVALIAGDSAVPVWVEAFDRFEYPSGEEWTPETIQAAVNQVVAGAIGRINRNHPGVLVFSAGISAKSEFDDTLIRAVGAAVETHGRKNRGLMAAGVVVLRIQPATDADTVRFGYALFPAPNRRYEGETALRLG